MCERKLLKKSLMFYEKKVRMYQNIDRPFFFIIALFVIKITLPQGHY